MAKAFAAAPVTGAEAAKESIETAAKKAPAAVSEETAVLVATKTCPNCGMTFGEFTKIGKFGCPECYRTFGPLIENEFKKFQADSHHIGKKYGKSIENQQIEAVLGKDDPAAPAKQETSPESAAAGEKSAQEEGGKAAEADEEALSIAELEKKKEEAVKREDYLEAARLRDAIRKAREKNE